MNYAVLFIIPLLLGLAAGAVGIVAAFISAQANMSFNNPLPRAGCAFLLVGGPMFALGIRGLLA